ncbi:hypothetical protein EDC94DRAFT_629959 [Helicostylum pulchrum]|nr:hypothetical protein EDC94DRAFT_629959 [Helicostylum pulchrum]
MNSQTQQIINIVFIFLFIITLSPITILLHLSAVYLTIQSSTTVPCSYTEMQQPSTLLKKMIPSTKVTPTVEKVKSAEKEEEEVIAPLKQKSKSLSRFFKKIAKLTSSIKSNKSSTQYKLTFIPITTKKNKIVTPAEPTELVWYQNKVDSSASQLAQRIWDQDTTVYNNLNKVVEWIGNGKESSNSILQEYMSRFNFSELNVEQAFRNLCSKLYLQGETQQIDRVLVQFADRYFECNPACIFGSTDVIHAIVYSLLLLNTDLHVAQGDYKKMSQSSFIKNTISAIPMQSGNTCIKSCSSLHRTTSNTGDVSAQSYTMPRNISTLSVGSKNWESEIKSMLKQMYTSIRHHQITDPSFSLASSQTNSSVSAAIKRSVGSIVKKKKSVDSDSETIKSVKSSVSSIMYYQAVASHLESTELPSSYTSNAPYYKEGMVTRKHLLESGSQKAKNRDWKDCFMIIERSQLRMYKLDYTCNNSDSDSIGGGNWMSHAQRIGAVDLKHALANALPSGYSAQRQHAFTLQESNGAVHVFQVGSDEQVEEWISTCNYWAARESKEPLVGGVSSIEYGWGHCLENGSTTVHQWQAPASATISSQLTETDQLEALYTRVQDLTLQLDQHSDIKSKMESHFSGSKVHASAMNNWETKSLYLLQEIIKYQNYCNSIEKSLSLQARIMA